MNPVLFGETLIGRRIPNLTYMLTFDSIAERDAAFGAFGSDPDWIKLRNDPKYANAVSNITESIFAPMPYSQM
jgi:hypothetical protein